MPLWEARNDATARISRRCIDDYERGNSPRAIATAQAVIPAPAEPLVWPVVTKVPAGIRSFAGHTDTVPDIVGRIGTPASLVIFTEGNHLMALLSDDILGAFPSWAKSQPRYADLDLDNIVVVTVPQPAVVQMIRSGGLALGNLVLEVSRKSGFYPDIVMAGPGPLRQLRQLGPIEPQARFFSRNRGFALLVRKGNPFGISGLTDVVRNGARLAQPDVVEAGSRTRYRAAVDELIGKQEVVIKGLGETFRNTPGVAGGAILGDGRVGLILDMDGLYKDRRSD